MKLLSKLAMVLLVTGGLGLSSCTSSAQIYSSDANYSANSDDFYNTLAPYGQWITYGDYGDVWVPNVGPDFRPYLTDGHWVYTDLGWTWASDYPWGWATFHYGRWFYDNQLGWAWIPGYQWSPAWVAWRSAPDYYGWAPLGPGMNIDFNVQIPYDSWCFIPRDRMEDRDIYRYSADRDRSEYYYRNSQMIDSRYRYEHHDYFRGPSRQDVGRYTHHSIKPVRIFQVNRPEPARMTSQGLSVYRPQMQRTMRGNDPVRTTGDPHNFDRSRMTPQGSPIPSNRQPGNFRNGSYGNPDRMNQQMPANTNPSYNRNPSGVYRNPVSTPDRTPNRYQRNFPAQSPQASPDRSAQPYTPQRNNPPNVRYERPSPQQRPAYQAPAPQRQYQQPQAAPRTYTPQRALPRNQMIMDQGRQNTSKQAPASGNQDHPRTLFDH